MRMPAVLAWITTFMFVNVTWVFFRAESLADASTILAGMVDISSARDVATSTLATERLAWGGTLSDTLLAILPVGIATNAACYFMILLGFFIISQRNSYDLTIQGYLGWKKIAWVATLFPIAMYSSIQTISTVFLYFNF